MCLPMLPLLRPQLKAGAVAFCNEIKKFRKTLATYVDYVRTPGSGLMSALLPAGDGLEYSVVVG